MFSSLVFGQSYGLWFEDEFVGNSLDTNFWTPQIGDGCPNLCGWGNNELEYYRAENATVANGQLTISAKQESFGGRNYTSSRLITKNKIDFTYGFVEARIDMPIGQGLWSAFWMLSTNQPYGTWPASGEIDIVEMLGHEPNKVHGTIHYGNMWPNNQNMGMSAIGNNYTTGFHTYGVEWVEDTIRWFVDSVKYFELTASDILPLDWRFDDDFHLLLNCAVGGNWPGNPDSTTVFPQEMIIDYVRVYKKGYTDISENELPQFSCYPNPVLNKLVIDNLPENNLNYRIINAAGQIIQSERLLTETIDCFTFKRGLYFIEIIDSADKERVTTLKFVKL